MGSDKNRDEKERSRRRYSKRQKGERKRKSGRKRKREFSFFRRQWLVVAWRGSRLPLLSSRRNPNNSRRIFTTLKPGTPLILFVLLFNSLPTFPFENESIPLIYNSKVDPVKFSTQNGIWQTLQSKIIKRNAFI